MLSKLNLSVASVKLILQHEKISAEMRIQTVQKALDELENFAVDFETESEEETVEEDHLRKREVKEE